MTLSTKPKSQLWKEDVSYERDFAPVWYNGCWYKYLHDTPSTPGQKPNEATAVFKARKNTPYDTEYETRTMRSWTIVDPRDPNNYNDVDSPPSTPTRVNATIASITSAVMRGIRSLSDQEPFLDDPFSDWQPYNSLPSFDHVSFNFTEKIDYYKLVTETVDGEVVTVSKPIKNYEESWYWYDNPKGRSTEYGKTTDGFTATSNYLFPCGWNWGDGVAFSSIIDPNPGSFSDNSGYFDRIKINLKDSAPATYSDPGTVTLVSSQALTYNLPEIRGSRLPALDNTGPIQLPPAVGWYGQTIGYRVYKIYASYTEVAIPGPYIGDDDIMTYCRNGGSLTLVSGDGITTPRVYDWVGPFSDLEIEYSNSGTLTVHSYGGTPPTVTETVTISGPKYVVEWGFVWKTVTPGMT